MFFFHAVVGAVTLSSLAEADCTTEIHQGLKALYDATTFNGLVKWGNGNRWMKTDSNNDPCNKIGKWEGTTSPGNSDYLLTIKLGGLAQTGGTMPSEIGLLSGLTGFDWSMNSITGTIPSEFGALTSLKSLNLGTNLFTGTLPSELGRLSSLTSFDV